MIEIRDGLAIPEDELRFTASRSGGPGGQHVNKVATRVTLHFDLEASPSLDPSHKRRIAARLAGRVGKDGVLRVSCGRHRSQARNRQETVERFAELLREALRRRRPRKPTRPSLAARERRLEAKRRRARLKATRSRRAGED